MKSLTNLACAIALSAACGLAYPAHAATKTEHFDQDPHWQSANNRIQPNHVPHVTQDFGYSATNHAGKSAGELGGIVSRASETAFYADKIQPRTLDDAFTASGSFAFTKTTGGGGVFFGFFRGDQPGATGRPISSLGLDFDCEGTGARLAVRLITAKNQSCGTFVTPFIPGKFRPTPIRNDGTRYTWTLAYDPRGANERGQFTFTIHSDTAHTDQSDDAAINDAARQEAAKRFPHSTTFTADLPEGFKQQGTTFDRFGLMNMTKPGGHAVVFFDDLKYGDGAQDFASDPRWDAVGNRRSYDAVDVAGAQNFGFSATNLAGGEKAGELGGTFWRTEGPVAWYGDAIGPLSLDDALVAKGKLTFAVGSPDSGMYIGFFNSKTIDQRNGLRDFLGVRVEGPTRVGHYFAPVVATSEGGAGKLEKAPVLSPGKTPHTWSIEYDPKANGGDGAVVVHLDDESATLNLKAGKNRTAEFDRFGVFTPRVGGSQVKIYLDDITYTASR